MSKTQLQTLQATLEAEHKIAAELVRKLGAHSHNYQKVLEEYKAVEEKMLRIQNDPTTSEEK